MVHGRRDVESQKAKKGTEHGSVIWLSGYQLKALSLRPRRGALLQRATGATRLSDGSVIVADLGEAPLRRFNADGSLATRISRAGSGPGEMQYLAWLFRCGDQFITYDIQGCRISIFNLDGKYQREFRFKVPTGQQVPYTSACSSDRRFAHAGWGRMQPIAGAHRDTVPLWTARAVMSRMGFTT